MISCLTPRPLSASDTVSAKGKGANLKKEESHFSPLSIKGMGMGGGRGMGGGGWFTSPLCRRRSNILLLAAAPSSNQGKT